MSMTRRRNLLALGERYKGAIDVATMKTIMDTRLEQGGATVDGTIFQVIAVPASRELWVKTPGHQDWTRVPLAPLFGKD